jgi:uncharacterized membrane protein
MVPIWILLALGGIVLAVAGTLFDKYLLEKYFDDEDEDGPGVLLIFSSLFLTVVISIVMVFKFDEISFLPLVIIIGLLVGVLNGLWILLYLMAINRAEVSKVVPLFQIVPIFGLFYAMIILGEFLTLGQTLSALIIVLGALVLLYTKGKKGLNLDKRTLTLMIGSSSLVALSQVLFKQTSLVSNYWTATVWLGSGFILFGLFLLIFIRSYRQQFHTLFKSRVKAMIGANAINEFFDNAGELIFLAAVVIGPVALVQSLNGYEPLLIFLASIIMSKVSPKYFDEDLSRGSLVQKFCGILIITIGSIYLYFSI